MIGKISGRLEYIGDDHVMIDTGGVGYVVYCSSRTLAGMPKLGAPVAVFTELLVREDNLQLFGFPNMGEREWHRLLVSVQGVGAKAALAIMGTLGADAVSRAITLGDQMAIKAAPGVGPKLAQRVVTELKDKAAKMMAMGANAARTATPPSEQSVAEPLVEAPFEVLDDGLDGNAQADALSALINLGYGHGDAASAIAQIGEGDAPDLIRGALRLLAPKG
ncbi:MAG: Holliday junction branch migration protein RuvA [Rhodobacteraceae bacterium]|nr:Holliday junction branch migration protein RuvA [Paracoccaceae bacterium]